MTRLAALLLATLALSGCSSPTAPAVPDCRALLSVIGREFYIDGRPPTDSTLSCRLRAS